MAHQEKLHFVVATNGQLDRFDGEPDHAYFEDIQKIMNKTFAAWDQQPTAADYLQPDSLNLSKDFAAKFPFSTERFHQKCHSQKDIKPEEKVQRGNIRSMNNPPRAEPAANQLGSLVVTKSSRKIKSDPRRSQQELRQAEVNLVCFAQKSNKNFLVASG